MRDYCPYLTGTEVEVAAAAKSYRIYYQEVEEPGASDYLMDHSSVIYLMGPDGSYLSHFTHASTAEDIAKGLAAQVDPARATAAAAGSRLAPQARSAVSRIGRRGAGRPPDRRNAARRGPRRPAASGLLGAASAARESAG